MIVLVTGSRWFANADVVRAALRETYDRALDVADAALFARREAWARLQNTYGEQMAGDLVAGWRDYDPTLTVRHGACPPRHDGTPGADELAHRWCQGMRYAVAEDPHPADWKTHGKAAGFRRNTEMVNAGPPTDVCLAFYWATEPCRGTGHTVKLAQQAGIPVRCFDGDGPLNFVPPFGRRHTRQA